MFCKSKKRWIRGSSDEQCGWMLKLNVTCYLQRRSFSPLLCLGGKHSYHAQLVAVNSVMTFSCISQLGERNQRRNIKQTHAISPRLSCQKLAISRKNPFFPSQNAVHRWSSITLTYEFQWCDNFGTVTSITVTKVSISCDGFSITAAFNSSLSLKWLSFETQITNVTFFEPYTAIHFARSSQIHFVRILSSYSWHGRIHT